MIDDAEHFSLLDVLGQLSQVGGVDQENFFTGISGLHGRSGNAELFEDELGLGGQFALGGGGAGYAELALQVGQRDGAADGIGIGILVTKNINGHGIPPTRVYWRTKTLC